MEAKKRTRSVRFRPVVEFIRQRNNYTLVLMLSRLALGLCYSAVAFDTWDRFKRLSRIPAEGNYDLSLDTLPSFAGDLSWVPTVMRPPGAPETYGTNRLFGLYLVRLSHHFHRRISVFLLYFTAAILALLVALSAFDLAVLAVKRLRLRRYHNTLLSARFVAFSLLFALVFSQFIFVLYYRMSLCALETLHPYLFARDAAEPRLEFLKAGVCSGNARFAAIYLTGFLTLVPDSFLILIAVLPAFRAHSLLNGIKYFGAIFFFVTAFVVLDAGHYIEAGQNPKVLDYGVTKYNERALREGRTQDVLRLLNAQKSPTMYSMKDTISYRVNVSMKGAEPGVTLEPRFQLAQRAYERQARLVHFNLGKQLYAQAANKFQFYVYFCFYAALTTVIDAVAGTVLMVKRHRFLLPIVAIVNFFYFFTHLLHCVMVQWPNFVVRFFCSVKNFAVEPAKLSFELLAIADLVCKMRDLYRSAFAMSVALVALALANVVNLYFIHKFH